MDAPGPLLASGRDADIFEYGPGRVLRRARDGRSLRDEASTMAYLHDHGYPVPRVDELSDDGVELVMERIEGPTMVEAIGAAPWTVRRHGHALAELHVALHELVAPPGMRAAPVGAGDRVVHLDLHPLNVLVGPRGPVVIDWSNASRGDPAVDVCGLSRVDRVADGDRHGGRRDELGGDEAIRRSTREGQVVRGGVNIHQHAG